MQKSIAMNNPFPICYETHGNPNHPCIILILGIGGQLIQWPKTLIDGLVKEFYVVTFDNRDSGLSQYYDHLGTPNLPEAIHARQNGKPFKPPYTLEDMASDVIMLMDKLSIQKAHILGGSMGGMIAQVFAIEHPERILSLILIATTSGDPHLSPAAASVLQFFSLSTSEKREKESLESYVESKTTLYRIYDPAFFNEAKTRALLTEVYKRAYYPDGFKRQLIALIFAEPRGEKLKKLQVKSLVIHGKNDPVFPLDHGKYLADCLTNSRLEIIEKMGHGLPDEMCKIIADLIADFINEEK
jgi:pimeloyl-ACP methyl ester carboxylesterase